MNGGIIKAAGTGAVAALAALLFSSSSALAADLGGNCCADLEERIAELEATTARKGNRKVSLTVYGWVHKGVLYWNDGHDSNTYFGVDNINYATRFGLRGDARINPNVSAGFNILFDITSGAQTSSVNQRREDNPLVASGPTGAAVGGLNTFLDDNIVRMRDGNVWIEHKHLGRLTVGHLTSTGVQGIVDLGGTLVASGAAIDLLGGGFVFRGANGGFSTATIASVTTNGADFAHRVDAIRWDSPTVHGFVVGLSAGEAATVDRSVPLFDPTTGQGPVGLYWAANIRYAGEFAGFRVAAAVGYEVSDGDEKAAGSTPSATGTVVDSATTLGYSASALHIASGLFAQGSWIRFERPNVVGSATATDEGTLWHIQAGISQNWFGIGKTVLYGEYAHSENMQRTFSNTVTSLTAGSAADYDMWGLGVVQNIDAAAMEIYLSYRRHSLSNAMSASTVGGALNNPAVVGTTDSLEDVHTVMGGMRIAF